MPDHNPYQPPSTLLAPTAAAEPVRRRLVRVVLWAAGLWALCWLLRFPFGIPDNLDACGMDLECMDDVVRRAVRYSSIRSLVTFLGYLAFLWLTPRHRLWHAVGVAVASSVINLIDSWSILKTFWLKASIPLGYLAFAGLALAIVTLMGMLRRRKAALRAQQTGRGGNAR